MNVRQYLVGIATDGQKFGSVDDAGYMKLVPGQTVFVVSDFDNMIEAKTYMIDSLTTGVNGTMIIFDATLARKTIEPRHYNVFQAVKGYGATMSRIFTDLGAAQSYVDLILSVLEIRKEQQLSTDKLMAAKLRGKA